MEQKSGFYIDSVIDQDSSVRAFAHDMEEDTALFMRLMNEANMYDAPANFDKITESLPERARAIVKSAAKKHGENYKRIICRVYEATKSTSTRARGDEWFFSNILFFTCETDPEHNATLKNLIDASAGRNVNIIVFDALSVSCKTRSDYIDIYDAKTSYRIKEQSNIDTICIARLGAQENGLCENCLKEIENWGIFTLNPIDAAQTASDKYKTAVLLEKHNIAQPKFALLTKSDIDNGMESLSGKLDVVHTGVKKKLLTGAPYDKTVAYGYQYVVKVLDGHGGTGVFMLDGKSILPVLQAIFEIDPDRELLLQNKEDGDGDIRVHVFTTNVGQQILGAMKRKKLAGDFRSNVSLGSEPAPVTLTEEQEKLAKNVAAVSGMPWCAVDIMHVKDDSEQKDVVLEYNASPGTDGISEVIGGNFMSVLLNAVNESRDELQLAPKQIGYIEDMTFKFSDADNVKFEAKFDTGNGALAPTLGCDKVDVDGNDVKITIDGKSWTYKLAREINPKVGQSREKRLTVIIPEISVGTRKLKNAEFAVVANRASKSTRVLVNRDIMRKMGFVINPNLEKSLNKQ